MDKIERAKGKRIKAAVIRDPGVPVGQYADLWIVCCGGRVFVSRTQHGHSNYTPAEIRCPACMAVYDARGFVIVQGMS